MAKSSGELRELALRQLRDVSGLAGSDTPEGIVCIRKMPLIGEACPATVMLSKQTGNTKSTHKSRLRRMAALLGAPARDHINGVESYQWLDWPVITADRFEAFIASLYEPVFDQSGSSSRRSPRTLNGFLSTYKSAMREASRMGLVDVREFDRVKEIKSLSVHREPAGRMVEAGEIADLLALITELEDAENTIKAVRDRAIVALAFFVGLRRGEISGLQLSGLELDSAEATVVGKGDKVAKVQLPAAIVTYLRDWLYYRGVEPGPVFCAVSKGGTMPRKSALTGTAIYQIVTSLALRAGIKHVAPHDGRRTFISNVLDIDGIDPATAMKLARHSSFKTTALYDRRGTAKQKAIVNTIADDLLKPTKGSE
ncbi:tyrosine-type recombinase/integrase [Marinobacterium jannaschii]|uniref:tyrosine-type recombinase/integrase n=1 Tax=Marinobacterium jannaschii TaxID=64970 RepID=UPI0012EC81D1|nr:tyrosine-type recombinase/integrase [Marinobacterium jannaschii]